MEKGARIDFWVQASQLFERICTEVDGQWQKRKRILTTSLLVVLILKMVLSKNKQGYGSNLDLLWESCAQKNIKLPKAVAIAASSLSEARQKLPESVFKELNGALIDLKHEYRGTPRWCGHRVFAVDGSKINAPRELIREGYKIAKRTGRHYPYATMSCLYNLNEQMVYDIELVPHGDERRCALDHFKHLTEGDLVIFDRGYFSYHLFYKIVELKLNAVFRMQGSSNPKIMAFWQSQQKEMIIAYEPSTTVKYELKKQGIVLEFKPLTMRLIKHQIGQQTYV